MTRLTAGCWNGWPGKPPSPRCMSPSGGIFDPDERGVKPVHAQDSVGGRGGGKS